jgi:hypothetical protein
VSWTESERKYLAENIKNWDNLELDEKIKVLQSIEDKIAEEQEREKGREVKIDDLPLNRVGEFRDYEPNNLYIDKKSLENGNVYDIINTLTHESRHGYQYDVVKGIIPEDKLDGQTKALKKDWIANFEVRRQDGIGKDDEYRFQHREDDANSFALKKTREIFKLSHEANKKQYIEHLKQLRQEAKDYRDMAREAHGADYKEKIQKEIIREYTRNVDVRDYAEKIEKIYENFDSLTNPNAVTTDPNDNTLGNAIENLRKEWNEFEQSLQNKHGLTPQGALDELAEYRKQNNDVKTMGNKSRENESTKKPRSSDDTLIKEAIKAGNEVERIEKQLNSDDISFDEKKDLQKAKDEAYKVYSGAMDKILERPNSERIIERMEKLQNAKTERIHNVKTPDKSKDSYSR